MRPEEIFRIRWEHINWTSGRYCMVFGDYGKTKSARRIVPLLARASAILQARWELTSKSEEPSSLKKQHVQSSEGPRFGHS